MEIWNYLRASKSRLALLLLIPLIATAAAVSYQSRQPAQFQTSGTVTVPTFYPGANPNAVTQSMNDFRQLIKSSAVGNQVQKVTGVSSGAVQKGIGTGQTTAGAVVNVTYTSSEREGGDAVIREAVATSLRTLFNGQVAANARSFQLAQLTAQQAQQQYDTAQAAADAFAKKVGVADPSEAAQSTDQLITQLKVSIAVAQSRGDPTSGLQQALTDAQAQQAKLAPVARSYAALRDAETRANQLLIQAQSNLATAQAQQSAPLPTATVETGNASKVSPTAGLVRLGAVVFVVALFLAIALIALLELLRPSKRYRSSRRGARREQDTGDEGYVPLSTEKTPERASV